MEPVEIFLTVVAVIISGGATIIAWAARHDALTAAKRAEAAEQAALNAWQQSANALTAANELRAKQHAERTYRERRALRVEPAGHARRWFSGLVAAKAAGVESASEGAKQAGLTYPPPGGETREEVALRLELTGEPAVATLLFSLDLAAENIPEDDHSAAFEAGATINSLVDRWIENPERFELETNTEEFRAKLLRVGRQALVELAEMAERRRAAAQRVRELEEEARGLDAQLAAVDAQLGALDLAVEPQPPAETDS